MQRCGLHKGVRTRIVHRHLCQPDYSVNIYLFDIHLPEFPLGGTLMRTAVLLLNIGSFGSIRICKVRYTGSVTSGSAFRFLLLRAHVYHTRQDTKLLQKVAIVQLLISMSQIPADSWVYKLELGNEDMQRCFE